MPLADVQVKNAKPDKRPPIRLKGVRNGSDESSLTKQGAEKKTEPAKFIDPKSKSHSKRVHAGFENVAFPSIGKRPIGEIAPKEMLAVISRIEERGLLMLDAGRPERPAASESPAGAWDEHNPALTLSWTPSQCVFPCSEEPQGSASDSNSAHSRASLEGHAQNVSS